MNSYPHDYSPSQIKDLLVKWNDVILNINDEKKKELTAILLENEETFYKEQPNENK